MSFPSDRVTMFLAGRFVEDGSMFMRSFVKAIKNRRDLIDGGLPFHGSRSREPRSWHMAGTLTAHLFSEITVARQFRLLSGFPRMAHRLFNFGNNPIDRMACQCDVLVQYIGESLSSFPSALLKTCFLANFSRNSWGVRQPSAWCGTDGVVSAFPCLHLIECRDF